LLGETGIISTKEEIDMEKSDKKEAGAFDRFKELARKLISVPKKEIDRKEAAYQKHKAKRKNRT